MKLIWLCCCALLTGNANCAVYKRVGADGTVTYTDTPGHNTQAVDLNSLTTNVIPVTRHSANATSSPPAKPAINYQLTIHSPQNNATIRDNTGALKVQGAVSPQRSGQFQLWLNNTVAATQTTPVFHLENVPRGEYAIQIKLLDNTGKQIASSEIITVYLHRASVLNRAN